MYPNSTLKISLTLCLALMLLIFPVINSLAFELEKGNKKMEKAERPVAQKETETLHSELLFR